MIEVTAEMLNAYEDAAGEVAGEKVRCYGAGLAAVLAIVEREHVILPRGAQALCCDDHPDVPVRWGTCPACLALMPAEDRT